MERVLLDLRFLEVGLSSGSLKLMEMEDPEVEEVCRYWELEEWYHAPLSCRGVLETTCSKLCSWLLPEASVMPKPSL